MQILEDKINNDSVDIWARTLPGYFENFSNVLLSANNLIDSNTVQYQYKFRKESETNQKYKTNSDFRERWIKAYDLKETFKDEEGILSDEYYSSGLDEEIKNLRQESLMHTVARTLNYQVEKAIGSVVKEVEITSHARKKAEYISKRVSELTSIAGKGDSYEIMFLLAGEEGSNTISDVEIVVDQKIYPSYCKQISGFKKTYEQLDNKNLEYKAHGHSHVRFDTYFSNTDDKANDTNFLFGYKINRIDQIHNGSNDQIKHFKFMVFNEKGDHPAIKVIAKKPRYYVENGQIKKEEEQLDFEYNIFENDKNHNNRWPQLKVIDEEKSLDVIQIDQDIISRVIFDDGTRLSDYLDNKEENIDKDTKIDLLELKIDSLESKLNILQENYDTLNQRVNTNYLFRISEYAQKVQNEENKYLEIISKIMAGEFRGNIDEIVNGDYSEKDGETRIWTWKDRNKAIETVVNSSDITDENKDELLEIAKSNKTLTGSEQLYLEFEEALNGSGNDTSESSEAETEG